MIDPCVFVDDDGQAYFYYGGGGRCVGAKLKKNMTEIAEPLRKMEGLKDFHEATWVHKRNGIYYLSYADNHVENGRGANRIHYATSILHWDHGSIRVSCWNLQAATPLMALFVNTRESGLCSIITKNFPNRIWEMVA